MNTNGSPLRYYERAALHGAGSELHWRSIVRSIVRFREGALPSDWQTVVVDSGLHARVSAHWPPPVCLGRWIADCTVAVPPCQTTPCAVGEKWWRR